MNQKANGAGNGRDKETEEEEKVLRFPSLAERGRMRKREGRQTESAEPFFNFGNLPPFTKLLTLSFAAVHLVLYLAVEPPERMEIFYRLGFVPGYFTGAAGGIAWSAFLGPFSHVFIHGSWMHLLFNSVMTLALGTFFEREFGTRSCALFFFLCSLAGAGLYFAINPFSTVPVIGASGGISGFFAAVLLLLHRDRQLGHLGRKGPWPLILFWAGFMVLIGLIGGSSMAWQAHLGGFLGGAALTHFMLKGTLRL